MENVFSSVNFPNKNFGRPFDGVDRQQCHLRTTEMHCFRWKGKWLTG